MRTREFNDKESPEETIKHNKAIIEELLKECPEEIVDYINLLKQNIELMNETYECLLVRLGEANENHSSNTKQA